jgi:hypothetical protein
MLDRDLDLAYAFMGQMFGCVDERIVIGQMFDGVD